MWNIYMIMQVQMRKRFHSMNGQPFHIKWNWTIQAIKIYTYNPFEYPFERSLVNHNREYRRMAEYKDIQTGEGVVVLPCLKKVWHVRPEYGYF